MVWRLITTTLVTFQSVIKLLILLLQSTEPRPLITELEKNISIRLVNAHSSTSHPRPKMPGLINVAGAHIKDSKPLPSDIQVNKLKNQLFFFLSKVN